MAESIFNNWNNVVAPVRNELVFEDRNKAYGAYYLRKNHNRTVSLALLITGLSFMLAVSAPAIIDWIKHKTDEPEVPILDTQVELTPPPPIDKTEPPPPPPPPPPVMQTVAFTPPVVTDEPIEEEKVIQEEETPQISTVTQEGSGEEVIDIPQDAGPAVVESVTEEPVLFVEQMPEFPGGESARMEWITKEIARRGYPMMEKEAGIQGTVYLSFVVEKDGKVSDVKVQRGIAGGPGYNKLAVEVAEAMPSWSIGKQNGRAQRVRCSMSIKFSLH
jgi:protein TonB